MFRGFCSIAGKSESEGVIDLMIEHIEKNTSGDKKNLKKIIPGYTHLQPAQPTTFAHYLISQHDILIRNLSRIEESYKRVNLSPMGAGALAATSFKIDRERVSDLLGFEGLIENSIDAVSSRDFILEILALMSLLGISISRFVEDLFLWSSKDLTWNQTPNA